MKVVILAGGLGTRIAEETNIRPKPMIEIGGKPILWHIMHTYAAFSHREFLLALGYRGEYIKEYFLNYYQLSNNITINLATGERIIHDCQQPVDWVIHMLDTGLTTQTGGRIKRLQPWVGTETFMATYGDGVANIDIARLLTFHRAHGKLATITAVRPPSRFGSIDLDEDQVVQFAEKPQIGEGWINGGYFVFQPEVFDYIEGDDTFLEHEPMKQLAADGQLKAYRHQGFWQPMDTLRDRNSLEALWESGNAPWKV